MHRVRAFRLILAAALLAAGTAHAQSVYMWTDSKGSMHITNDPPPAGARKIDTMDATPPPQDAEQPPAPDEDTPSAPQEAPAPEGDPEAAQKEKANAARLAEIKRELASLKSQRDELSQRYIKARNIDYSRAIKLNLAHQIEDLDKRIMELQNEARRLR